jgi:hypothetical protein
MSRYICSQILNNFKAGSTLRKENPVGPFDYDKKQNDPVRRQKK